MCLNRAEVIGSDDEEQVCKIINQVQVRVISDGGYGPFCNSYVVSGPLKTFC